MQEDSLKKRYSFKLLSNIFIAIIGIVTIAIVPTALGPVAYGQFSYLQQFFAKIIGFLDMGSSIAFFTKLSANPKRKELITFYAFYSSFILTVILLFFYFANNLGYIDLFLPDIGSEYLFLAIGFAFLTWGTQIFIKISDAYALTVSVELIKIVHKILSLGLLLYLIYFLAFDLTQYFYFHYISLLSFLAVLSYLFIKKGIFKNLKFSILNSKFSILTKEFISYCSPLVVYSIAGLLTGLFDIWILQKMGGTVQTGYYGLAYSIVAMSFLFTSAMTPIITREFSKSYAEKDIAKMRKLFFRYIPMLYAIAAYFGVFISFQSENLLAIFTGSQFQDALWVLAIMAFYPLHQTYGQLSGSIFYATGQTKLYRNIGLVSMASGLALSFGFIYLLDLGAIGLALKMIIGQAIGTSIQLYFNAKFLDFKVNYFFKHQLGVLLFFILPAAVSSVLFSSVSSNLLSFLLSGVSYTLFVIILAYFIPQVFAITREEYLQIFKRFSRVIKK